MLRILPCPKILKGRNPEAASLGSRTTHSANFPQSTLPSHLILVWLILADLPQDNSPQPTHHRIICHRTIWCLITREEEVNCSGPCLDLGLNLLQLQVLEAGASCNSTCPSLELTCVELSHSKLPCGELAVVNCPQASWLGQADQDKLAMVRWPGQIDCGKLSHSNPLDLEKLFL